MAVNTSLKIDLTGKNSTTNTITLRSSTDVVSRTDLEKGISGTVSIASGTTYTIELDTSDIDVVRMIFIEAAGPLTVSLLDNDAATNEIVNLKMAGPSGAGASKLYAEIEGFTVASGDTMTIQNASGGAIVCSYFVGGDTA